MTIHTKLLPALLSTSEPHKGSTRPTLQYLHVDDLGRYETTDTYSMTRITPKPIPAPFPQTSGFWSQDPIWRPTDKHDLIHACELAISTLKALGKSSKTKYPVLLLNGTGTLVMPGTALETVRVLVHTLNHSMPTKVDAKRLLAILKSVMDFPKPLEWFQESPLSPLQFRQETEYGTIEMILMPLF